MNIHHLELFYYAAKHGGIAGAVRNMPYGIQQPALSGQIARLEESLGAKLFNRRPFALLPAGKELFDFIEPFFADVENVAETIRGQGTQHLRIAAPSIVLHDYLPDLLRRLRQTFPKFRLSLRETARSEAERLLQNGEVDVAITAVERKGGTKSRSLLELPMVLLVNSNLSIKRPDELWERDKIDEPLISFPRSDPMHALYQRGLKQLGVDWFPSIEVNSVRLVECYVASGYGIGITVATPGYKPPRQIRVLSLPDFPRVLINVAWAGKPSLIARQFVRELEIEASKLERRLAWRKASHLTLQSSSAN